MQDSIGTTSFQSGIIANMTTTEFWEGMAYTGINSQTVNFSIITTGHPQLVEARGMIPWLHSAAFLVNICTSASKTAKEDSVERMLSRALATSSKARQTAPLVCFPQSSTSSPWNEWTVRILFPIKDRLTLTSGSLASIPFLVQHTLQPPEHSCQFCKCYGRSRTR